MLFLLFFSNLFVEPAILRFCRYPIVVGSGVSGGEV